MGQCKSKQENQKIQKSSNSKSVIRHKEYKCFFVGHKGVGQSNDEIIKTPKSISFEYIYKLLGSTNAIIDIFPSNQYTTILQGRSLD